MTATCPSKVSWGSTAVDPHTERPSTSATAPSTNARNGPLPLLPFAPCFGPPLGPWHSGVGSSFIHWCWSSTSTSKQSLPCSTIASGTGSPSYKQRASFTILIAMSGPILDAKHRAVPVMAGAFSIHWSKLCANTPPMVPDRQSHWVLFQ